nr:tripartite tricarboxylate transporter permease [Archaeoglobus neptunius]
MVGTLLGIVAGIIPGIHSNTFAILVAINSEYFENPGIVIVCSSIAYTIADIIPTTILGVPDEETVIATFPVHQMVMEGRAMEAVTSSVISSFLSILMVVPMYFTVSVIASEQRILKLVTPAVLVFTSVFMILSEKSDEFEGSLASWRKRFYATLVFAVSGFAGYVAFRNMHLADANPAGSVLLPLLTGLFGVPVLLQSSSSSFPDQIRKFSFPDVNPVARGSLAGFLVSMFPGVSSGIATLIASAGERDREGYIAAMSAANTSNAVLSFYIYMALGKTRSGAATSLKRLGYIPDFYEIALLVVVAGLISLVASLVIAYIAMPLVSRVNMQFLSVSVFGFLIYVVYTFTGTFGIVVFFSVVPIGLAATFLEIRRVNCMGSLIIPVLLFYLS